MEAVHGRRNRYLTLGLVVVAAIAFRAGLASFPRVIRWDEPDYLWLGRNLLSGQGYTISGTPELHYTPLFPLLAGAIYRLTGNPEVGSAFWYVLLGGLLPIPVHFIARRIYGGQVAVLSAVLTAVFPGLSSAILYWGTMTEPLFVFLVCCSLWTVLSALHNQTWWRFSLLGALLGLAYLARPEGLMWIGASVALFAVVWALRGQLWRWRSLLYLGALLVASIIIFLPYAAYIHQHTGRWMATGKLAITYDIGEAVLENDPALYDKVTASLDQETGEILWWSGKRFERSMLDILLADPAGALKRTWRNAGRMRDALLSGAIFSLFLLGPVLLGWFHEPWTRRHFEHELVLWFSVLPVLSFLPFHVEARFFSPAFPVVLIWIAKGTVEFGRWAGRTGAEVMNSSRAAHQQIPDLGTGQRIARWATAAVSVLLVGYLSVVNYRTVSMGMRGLSYAHKIAGLWLRENTSSDASVMSRDLAISLYADRGFVASPRAEYESYLDYARRKGATHLVVDDREMRVLRPQLAFLGNTDEPPPGLEPVFIGSDENGRTIVYKLAED